MLETAAPAAGGATAPLGPDEVRRALAEDRAFEDLTTRLLGRRALRMAEGRFIAEQRSVVAGLDLVGLVFRELDPEVAFEPVATDGTWVEAGAVIAAVRGPAAALLAGERTALNFLQRLSGIATATRRAVEAVAGSGAIITDTRKTTPGLRALEKYAVRVGGGVNHRHSLADGVLFKDNHWTLLGSDSLSDVLARVPPGVPVVVEVETDRQLEQALAAGVRRILIDNQPPERVAQWAQRAGPGVEVEASGGITPDNAAAYARAGAKYLSLGALTHSAPAAAIRFELEPAAPGRAA